MFKNTNFRHVQPGPKPFVFAVFALFILWGFGYETLWDRLTTDIDGMVVSRQDLPRTRWKHGSGTRYLIRGADVGIQEYVSGATDASLSRTIPAGSRLQKRKWQLSYTVDSVPIDDFPRYFYFLILSGAIALLFWSGNQSRKLAASGELRNTLPDES